MKKLTDQINNTEGVHMTSEEKEQIFNNLETMVMATPESVPSFIQLTPSPLYAFQFTRTRVMVLALLAVFVFSGSVSMAAQKALPGDSLYSIKTNVNEKVAGLLIFNSNAQVSYEADIAFRRLEEAEELGAEGRLDENTKVEIESKFTEHADKVEGKLSTEADLDFHSKLEAHRNILLKLAAKSGNKDEVHLHNLAARLNNQISKDNQKKIDAGEKKMENHPEQVKMFESAIESKLNLELEENNVSATSSDETSANDDDLNLSVKHDQF